MYAAVIFDLFGTLVPYIGENEIRASLDETANALDCSAKDLDALWFTEQGFTQAVTGQRDSRTRFMECCYELCIPATEERITSAIRSRLKIHREWLRPLPTTVEALLALRNGGKRLGLMSVCSDEVPAIWHETALAPYFDAVLFSCEVGLLKDDPKFFLEACRRLSVNPKEVIYVGDSQDELETALLIGMSPVLIKTRKHIHWSGRTVDSPIEVVAMAVPKNIAGNEQRKSNKLPKFGIAGNG